MMVYYNEYAADQLRGVAENGPHPDEGFYRLQVAGWARSNWLNITPEQLESIISALRRE